MKHEYKPGEPPWLRHDLKHKSPNATLVSALRLLAQDIDSKDGVANAAIAEAAERLESLNASVLCMVGVLRICANKFDAFARYHRMHADLERESDNRKLACMCEEAIAKAQGSK